MPTALPVPRAVAERIRSKGLAARAIESRAKAWPWYALGILAAAGIWQWTADFLGPYRLPSLQQVGTQFFPLLTSSRTLSFQGGGNNGYLPHLLHTISFTVLGSAIGVAAGVGIGLAMARAPLLRGIAEIPIELLRTIPPLAAVPFILIWIGAGNSAELLMVGYYVFVMMVVTTLNAASNVDPLLPTYAATMGAKPNRIFRNVIFPAMTPTIIGGVRVAVGIAWSVQVVAELMGGGLGMGRVFSAMISFQALDAIVVGILWLALAAAALDLLLVLAARRLTRWTPSSNFGR
jgi:ABC-type nitrate/sulfonate/bicarbonate transport system permease component